MVRTDDKVALGIMRRSEARQIQDGNNTMTMCEFKVISGFVALHLRICDVR